LLLPIILAVFVPAIGVAQNQDQSSQTQQKQDIPDAPSVGRPAPPPPAQKPDQSQPFPSAPQPRIPANQAPPRAQQPENPPADQTQPLPAPPFSVKTVPQGSVPAATPANADASSDLYKVVRTVNQVIVPVMVKDENGHLVSGLLPKDFSVYDNNVKQKMNFFTSDPFAMSVAVVFDLGMDDVAVQKVNKTFPALEGAFSQFDEVGVYTYSSTTAQVADFSGVGKLLVARLNELKSVTGRNNGPPVTSGPLGPQGPTINGQQIDPSAPIVYTPPREAHVLNDAILRAAVDLSKRDPTRRKVIFIITNGREYGSTASFRDVLRLLLSNNIMVYGVGVEGAAIPLYNKLSKFHVPKLGYTNILPKYANATGGEIYNEFSQSAIEDVYSRAIGDARNQYTVGYITPPAHGGGYHQIEVRVDRPGCKSSDLRPCVMVYAKDGYYPAPPRR
jgi:VWFA-related protein